MSTAGIAPALAGLMRALQWSAAGSGARRSRAKAARAPRLFPEAILVVAPCVFGHSPDLVGG